MAAVDSKEEIVEMALHHLGRHIASSDDAEGSVRLSRLINAFEIGRRYHGADDRRPLFVLDDALNRTCRNRCDMRDRPHLR